MQKDGVKRLSYVVEKSQCSSKTDSSLRKENIATLKRAFYFFLRKFVILGNTALTGFNFGALSINFV
ncbi:hypothetical protein Ciccas_012966, partial [Cichlidogyrus casuarinus]